MWLLIDDERNLGCDVIARTSEGARRMLAECKWEGLCLDHDLGGSETGYDVLSWALEHGHVPAIVELVTSNPAGRDRMGAALVASGYVKKSPQKYIREGYSFEYVNVEFARKLETALREIIKGEGPFSRDHLTHATNCIESMREIARQALTP